MREKTRIANFFIQKFAQFIFLLLIFVVLSTSSPNGVPFESTFARLCE